MSVVSAITAAIAKSLKKPLVEELVERFELEEDDVAEFVTEFLKKHMSAKGGRGSKAAGKKRPISGYIVFGKENRAKIAKKNPKASNKEMMGLVAAEWKKLSDAKKAVWNKKAAVYNKEQQDDNPSPAKGKEKEDDNDELNEDTINEWCGPISKGGLKLKALREKAEECGVEDASEMKRSDIKTALMECLTGKEEDDNNELDEDTINEWCGPVSKGGLKLKALREKAEENGVDGAAEMKRGELKTALLELLQGDEDDEEEEEDDEEEEIVLDEDTINEWCGPTSKGGLKLKELREKAEECGVEGADVMTRGKIKTALMELLEE